MPEKEHDIEIQIDIVNIAYVLRGFDAIRELKEFLDEHASLVVSHSRLRGEEDYSLTASDLPFPSSGPPNTQPLRATNDTPDVGGVDSGQPTSDGGNGNAAQSGRAQGTDQAMPTPDTQALERGGGAEAA